MEGNGQADNIDSIVLEEEIDPNYVPSESEVVEYAKWLGMDLERDKDLYWIAREGLMAPQPNNWKPCKTKDTEDIYYFNFATGESTWDHPCDGYYKRLYEEEKKKKETQAKANNDAKRHQAKQDVEQLLGKKDKKAKKKPEPLTPAVTTKKLELNPVVERKPLPTLSKRAEVKVESEPEETEDLQSQPEEVIPPLRTNKLAFQPLGRPLSAPVTSSEAKNSNSTFHMESSKNESSASLNSMSESKDYQSPRSSFSADEKDGGEKRSQRNFLSHKGLDSTSMSLPQSPIPVKQQQGQNPPNTTSGIPAPIFPETPTLPVSSESAAQISKLQQENQNLQYKISFNELELKKCRSELEGYYTTMERTKHMEEEVLTLKKQLLTKDEEILQQKIDIRNLESEKNRFVKKIEELTLDSHKEVTVVKTEYEDKLRQLEEEHRKLQESIRQKESDILVLRNKNVEMGKQVDQLQQQLTTNNVIPTPVVTTPPTAVSSNDAILLTEIDTLKKQCSVFETEKKSYEAKLKSMDSLQLQLQSLQKENLEITKQKEEEVLGLKKQLLSKEEEILQQKKELDKLGITEEEIRKLQDHIRQKESEIQGIQTKNIDMMKQIDQLQQQLKNATLPSSTTPTVESSENTMLLTEIDTWKKQYSTLETENKTMITNYETKLKAMDSLQLQLQSLQKENLHLTNSIMTKQQENKSLHEQLQTSQQSLDQSQQQLLLLQKQEEVAAVVKDSTSNDSLIEELRTRLHNKEIELSMIQTKYTSLQEEKKQQELMMQQQLEELTELRSNLSTKSSQESDLRYDQLMKEKQQLQERLQQLETLYDDRQQQYDKLLEKHQKKLKDHQSLQSDYATLLTKCDTLQQELQEAVIQVSETKRTTAEEYENKKRTIQRDYDERIHRKTLEMDRLLSTIHSLELEKKALSDTIQANNSDTGRGSNAFNSVIRMSNVSCQTDSMDGGPPMSPSGKSKEVEKVEMIEKTIAEEEKLQLQQSLQQKQHEIFILQQKYQFIESNRNEFQEKTLAYEQELSQLQQQLQSLQQTNQELQSKLSVLSLQQSTATATVTRDLDSAQATAGSLSLIITAKEQEIAQLHRQLVKVQFEYDQLQLENQSKQKTMDWYQEEIHSYQSQLQQMTQSRDTFQEQNQRLSLTTQKLTEELNQKEKKLKSFTEELLQVQKRLDDYQQSKRIDCLSTVTQTDLQGIEIERMRRAVSERSSTPILSTETIPGLEGHLLMIKQELDERRKEGQMLFQLLQQVSTTTKESSIPIEKPATKPKRKDSNHIDHLSPSDSDDGHHTRYRKEEEKLRAPQSSHSPILPKSDNPRVDFLIDPAIYPSESEEDDLESILDFHHFPTSVWTIQTIPDYLESFSHHFDGMIKGLHHSDVLLRKQIKSASSTFDLPPSSTTLASNPSSMIAMTNLKKALQSRFRREEKFFTSITKLLETLRGFISSGRKEIKRLKQSLTTASSTSTRSGSNNHRKGKKEEEQRQQQQQRDTINLLTNQLNLLIRFTRQLQEHLQRRQDNYQIFKHQTTEEQTHPLSGAFQQFAQEALKIFENSFKEWKGLQQESVELIHSLQREVPTSLPDPQIEPGMISYPIPPYGQENRQSHNNIMMPTFQHFNKEIDPAASYPAPSKASFGHSTNTNRIPDSLRMSEPAFSVKRSHLETLNYQQRSAMITQELNQFRNRQTHSLEQLDKHKSWLDNLLKEVNQNPWQSAVPSRKESNQWGKASSFPSKIEVKESTAQELFYV